MSLGRKIPRVKDRHIRKYSHKVHDLGGVASGAPVVRAYSSGDSVETPARLWERSVTPNSMDVKVSLL